MKTKFPHHEAAELRTVMLWVCKTCSRAYPEKGGERSARYCCTGQTPCGRDGCASLSLPHHSLCEPHDVEARAERWAKRERVPLNDLYIYSETCERFFSDEGDAWTEAEDRVADALMEGGEDRDPTADEIRAEIAAMHLVVCEPLKPPMFDVREHLSDWLPDEDNGDPNFYVDQVKDAEKAMNEALSQLRPLHYPTEKALDLSCFDGPDGPFAKAKS